MIKGRLSVVIPHWNAKNLLPTCLEALRAQSYQDLEIILVDNASSDGSAAFIRAEYPEVCLLELDQNRGFTGACNAGIEAASGEFICLLNNDTEVVPEWASAIIKGFAAFPEAGFAASRMMLFDRRDHFHAAGDFVRINGEAGNRGVWEKDEGQYEQAEFVFSACGGASVYRREMLDKIGKLDDDFFFSCEDIDLAWRAQLAGYRCIYLPEARVYHMLSATGGGVTASYYVGRNHIWVLVKNYPLPLWKNYRAQIIGHQLKIAREAARAWRGKAARARLRGMLDAFWGLPKMLAKRRQIQAQRQASIEYLEAMLTGD